MRRNKKVGLLIGILCIIIIFGGTKNIYEKYYKIDTAPFKFVFLSRRVCSLDLNFVLTIKIFKDYKDSDITYIAGELSKVDERKNKQGSKRIFWQKVNSESISNNNWIDVEWVDTENVLINGLRVNIKKGYDFRRDEAKFFAGQEFSLLDNV